MGPCWADGKPLSEPNAGLVYWRIYAWLVMGYGKVDLGHHWFRYWPVTWWHQAIALNYAKLFSVGPLGRNLSEILIKIYKCIWKWQGRNLSEILIKIYKCIWKCHLQSGSHLIQVSSHHPIRESILRKLTHCPVGDVTIYNFELWIIIKRD